MPHWQTTIASTLLLLGALGIARANEDAVLSLRSDGSIPELPEEFQPAHLSLHRSSSGKVAGAVLGLSRGEYTFPECVVRLFDKNPRFVLTAFWGDHQEPDYLSITLQHVESAEVRDGFQLLFNLRTAEMLELDKVHTKRPSRDTTTRYDEPAFDRVCRGKKMTDGWRRRDAERR